MATRVSLYGDDEDQFQQFKEAVTEARNGNEPSNAEVLRLMMQELNPDDVTGSVFGR